MLETSLAFQGFVAASPLPIFEPKVGGHKISSQGRGFWRGVVIRTSDGSGTAEQMMVVVKVNGRYLMEDAEEGTARLWAGERARLGTTMAAAVPAGASLSLLVQYDGAVPAGITTGKAQANSWFRPKNALEPSQRVRVSWWEPALFGVENSLNQVHVEPQSPGAASG
eukprot:COSAG04_NODE_2077_length_4851_cov_6.312921_3_plen_167_part_00